MTDMSTAKDKMIHLELRHAASAIERARLLSKGTDIEKDVGRLLDTAKDTLGLVDIGDRK